MRLIPLLFILASLLGGCIAEPSTLHDGAERTAADDACRPGQMRPAEDGCNQCRCDADGAWQCGQLACAVSCTAGETQRPDACLLCTCAEAGWQCEDTCTLNADPDGDGSEGVDGVEDLGVGEVEDLGVGGTDDLLCEPGETRPGECGDCQCDVDGTWLCDAAECPPEPTVGCAVDTDCVITGCQMEVCAAAETDDCDDDLDVDLCFAPQITTCGCADDQCAWAQTDALLGCLEP